MHPVAKLARCARVFLLPFALVAFPAGAIPADPPNLGLCANGGSVQLLAKIFNTRDRNVECLGVTVDGGAIKALRVENHRFAPGNGGDVKVEEFSVAEIESRHGAVLDGTPGHDAVIVQGRVSPSGGSADLVTRYLYNGLTGEYHSCRIKLDRDGGEAAFAWRLVNRYNETVSRIVVRTRHVPVLGTIGIESLDGACTPVGS